MKYWFSYEKYLDRKVNEDSFKFMELLKMPIKITMPIIKAYRILNYPNKLIGQRFPFKIYLHKENKKVIDFIEKTKL